MTIAERLSQTAHLIHGAGRLAKALATGDWADDATVEARRAICRECPTRVRRRLPAMDAESDWCGEPLVNVPGVSCGCNCALKTAVASEACPQRKWAAVTVSALRARPRDGSNSGGGPPAPARP